MRTCAGCGRLTQIHPTLCKCKACVDEDLFRVRLFQKAFSYLSCENDSALRFARAVLLTSDDAIQLTDIKVQKAFEYYKNVIKRTSTFGTT